MQLAEPAGDAEPAGQGRQVAEEVAPAIWLTLPAGHCEHVVAPATEPYVPAGQAWQSEEEALPVERVRVPAGQRVHDGEPVDAE